MFGPNQRVGGRFVLLAKEWNNRRGKVTYDNEIWKNLYQIMLVVTEIQRASSDLLSFEVSSHKRDTLKS